MCSFERYGILFLFLEIVFITLEINQDLDFLGFFFFEVRIAILTGFFNRHLSHVSVDTSPVYIARWFQSPTSKTCSK